MAACLLDTHAWVWSFGAVASLSDRAKDALTAAEIVYVSPISFFEIGQKVRVGKWPEMEALAPGLPELLYRQGGHAAPLTPEICVAASLMEWAHRDPFDRILAATAQALNVPLVSCDTAFDGAAGLTRIW